MKKTIWAVIGVEKEDGIITMGDSVFSQMPLVTMSEMNVPSMKKVAEQISKASGKVTVVAKFTLETELERYGK